MLKDLYYSAGAAWAGLQRVHPVGTSIFESGAWDICIVLDSARADMLADSLDRHTLEVDAVDRRWSVGSVTTEWLANTFRRSAPLSDVALVSATPHTATVFGERSWLISPDDAPVRYPDVPVADRDAFAGCYELWREHATYEDCVPPDVMRDATIEAYERHESVVAHWLQPHEPWIAPDARLLGGPATATNVWNDLAAGEVALADVRQSIRTTLDWTLDFVADVLTSVDADVLITSDHGNAFGEWGIYGHPFAWPQPAVRRVPWVEATATPISPVEPQGLLDHEPSKPADEDRDAQLRALGYL